MFNFDYDRNREINRIVVECKMATDNEIIKRGLELIGNESKRPGHNLEAIKIAARSILEQGDEGKAALLCILKAPLPSKIREVIIGVLKEVAQ